MRNRVSTRSEGRLRALEPKRGREDRREVGTITRQRGKWNGEKTSEKPRTRRPTRPD